MPRVREGTYTLSGLVGFELTGKTYGVVGTGKIGIEMIKLLKPFAAKVLAYDVYQSDEAKALGELLLLLLLIAVSSAAEVQVHRPYAC